MSRTQRLMFLAIAVVIAIGSLILISASGGDDEPATTSARATATPAPTETAVPDSGATETPAPTATPAPEPPLVTPAKLARLRFTEGDTVRFRVRADTADHVHVHGYDLMKDVGPGETIAFAFPADITGIFEIELEDAGQQIAQLRVDPK